MFVRNTFLWKTLLSVQNVVLSCGTIFFSSQRLPKVFLSLSFPKVKMIRIPPTNVDRHRRPCGKSSRLNNNPYLRFPIKTDKKRAFTRFNWHECDFEMFRFCRKHITSAGKPLTYYYGRVVGAI